jgi:hypothetical protein
MDRDNYWRTLGSKERGRILFVASLQPEVIDRIINTNETLKQILEREDVFPVQRKTLVEILDLEIKHHTD